MGYQVVFRKDVPASAAFDPHMEVVQVSHDEVSGEAYLQSRVRNAGDAAIRSVRATFSVMYADGASETVEAHLDGAAEPLAASAAADLTPVKLSRADVQDVEVNVAYEPAGQPESSIPLPAGAILPPPPGVAPVSPEAVPVAQGEGSPVPEPAAEPAPEAPTPAPEAPGPIGMPPAPAMPFEPVPEPSGTPTVPTGMPVAPGAPAGAMPAAPAPQAAADQAAPKKKRPWGVILGVIVAVALVFAALSQLGGGSGGGSSDLAVGRWLVAGIQVDGDMFVDGENTTIDQSENYLEIDADGTLELTLNGNTTTGSWEHDDVLQAADEDDDGSVYYRMEMLDVPFVVLVNSEETPMTMIAMAEEKDGYSMFLKRE